MDRGVMMELKGIELPSLLGAVTLWVWIERCALSGDTVPHKYYN